jgi:hypothetical protein
MNRQITNAVDAGDGDYITRTLREKLVAKIPRISRSGCNWRNATSS